MGCNILIVGVYRFRIDYFFRIVDRRTETGEGRDSSVIEVVTDNAVLTRLASSSKVLDIEVIIGHTLFPYFGMAGFLELCVSLL